MKMTKPHVFMMSVCREKTFMTTPGPPKISSRKGPRTMASMVLPAMRKEKASWSVMLVQYAIGL